MKIFPPEPDVDLYNEGFGSNDILQRKQIGEALSNMLERIDDPLVIALNGEWGTGKTYFLKRWIGAHTKENGSNATTVYFDAFAHDYVSDPLPALVSALAERLPTKNKQALETVKTAAFKLAKPIAKMGLAVATFGATEALGEVGDIVAQTISGETAGAIDKYWERETGRREAMEDFRQAFKKIADRENSNDTGSSLVFVIDELDRCRPSYALEVLEVIKHFFTVPHVHFVLGVKLKSLENSVKFTYGNDIGAWAYLKKFIQIQLDLPDEVGYEHNSKSANIVYLENILPEMGIPRHICDPLIQKMKIISRFNHVSIRDINNIVSSVAMSGGRLLADEKLPRGWVDVSVDLLIAKHVNSGIYHKFLNASVDNDDLAAYFGATGDVIDRGTDGRRNQNYENEIFLSYALWLFIAQKGTLEKMPDLILDGISKLFSEWGYDGDTTKIPMTAHRQWIDRFSFYSPDSSKNS